MPMDRVSPDDFARDGAAEINKTRDYILEYGMPDLLPIANGGTGQTSVAAARNAFGLGNTTGPLPIANGGTGANTAAAARTALGVRAAGAVPWGEVSGKPATFPPSGHTHPATQITSGTMNGSFGATGNIENNGVMRSAGSRNLVVTSNYVSAYLDASGYLGYAPSARRFKTDIEPWQEDVARILDIQPVAYRLIADVDAYGDDAPTRVGFIAEDLVAAGLEELVPVSADPEADDYGLPISINYEFYVIALQLVVRHQAGQIAAIESRLAALEEAR